MIKGYVKGIVKDEIKALERAVNGAPPAFSGMSFYFGEVGLKPRVNDLEQKVDLLLKHLGLCKTDVPAVPAKTVLKKCKEAAK